MELLSDVGVRQPLQRLASLSKVPTACAPMLLRELFQRCTVLKAMALDGRCLAWLPRSLISDELAARRLVAARA